MGKRTTWILTMLLLGASVSTVASAQPRRGGGAAKGGERAEARLDRISEFLQLTEEQEAEWRAIHREQRAQMGPLLQGLRASHEALRAELERETPDTVRLGELLLETRNERQAMEQLREASQDKLATLLDADQQVRWEALQEARGDVGGPGRRSRRGHRGARGLHP